MEVVLERVGRWEDESSNEEEAVVLELEGVGRMVLNPFHQE